MKLGRRRAATLAASITAASLFGCHEVSDFSTSSGGSYQGSITGAHFVRTGIGASVRMCLAIDADRLQDAPGTISTSDGLFQKAALRPIPQFWQDPLSTFNFGEGRIQNVLYVASENAADTGTPLGASGDVFVVLSFMVAGTIEVRLLRGAPGAPAAGDDGGAGPPSLFGVFSLTRESGSCPF